MTHFDADMIAAGKDKAKLFAVLRRYTDAEIVHRWLPNGLVSIAVLNYSHNPAGDILAVYTRQATPEELTLHTETRS